MLNCLTMPQLLLFASSASIDGNQFAWLPLYGTLTNERHHRHPWTKARGTTDRDRSKGCTNCCTRRKRVEIGPWPFSNRSNIELTVQYVRLQRHPQKKCKSELLIKPFNWLCDWKQSTSTSDWAWMSSRWIYSNNFYIAKRRILRSLNDRGGCVVWAFSMTASLIA